MVAQCQKFAKKIHREDSQYAVLVLCSTASALADLERRDMQGVISFLVFEINQGKKLVEGLKEFPAPKKSTPVQKAWERKARAEQRQRIKWFKELVFELIPVSPSKH
jgi:hypothetical protein